jgi:hypothetical protein
VRTAGRSLTQRSLHLTLNEEADTPCAFGYWLPQSANDVGFALFGFSLMYVRYSNVETTSTTRAQAKSVGGAR